MTKDSIDVTSEMFGRGVLLYRVEASLSQRELAEKLRAEGLTFDTAAISRIESGKRAVRLSEAVTIASVLGVPLEMLVSGGLESPAAFYDKATSRANQTLVDLRRVFVESAKNELQVVSLLKRHPELLARVHSPREVTADAYIAHVADTRRSIETNLRTMDALDNGRYVFVESDRERRDLVDLALAVIETAIVTREEVQALHAEAEDAAE